MRTRSPFRNMMRNMMKSGVLPDENGEWTKITSSANRRRMMGPNNGYWKGGLEKSKLWVPRKIFLTELDLERKYEEQNGKCFYFNLPLDLNLLFRNHKDFRAYHPLSPSMDAIDNEGDYTYENTVMCFRIANVGRATLSFEEMREIIKLLLTGCPPPENYFRKKIEDKNGRLGKFV